MSIDRHRFRLLIQATSFVETDKGPPAWHVDVTLNGSIISEHVLLPNPLDNHQSAELSWYLERYANKSALEVARADAASAIVDIYGLSLFEALLLFRVAGKIAKSKRPGPARLDIEISELPSSSTIQQLHWETLEANELWNIAGLRATVTRIVKSTIPFALETASTKTPISDPKTSTLNVLVVIARNTAPGSSDVDPSLAIRSLQAVSQTIERTDAPCQLKLEIVRPGTFAALKEHLKANGPGFFHLVHFDLHGQVRKRPGEASKTAFLRFASSTKPGELASITAREVARTLLLYDVHVAILNSCQSGRANAGDEANLAKTFVAEGIRTVLAMSFKLLEMAASLLLQSFYRWLVVQQETVVEAAQKARAMLRKANKRIARFGREVELHDWIVPVVYSSREGVGPTEKVVDVPNKVQEPTVPENNGEGLLRLLADETTTVLRLIGRDFDLIRFENLIMGSKVVALTGAAGVDEWSETQFVAYILFKLLPSDTATTSVFRAAIPRLLHDMQGFVADVVIPNLPERRQVLVFDDLQLAYSGFDFWGGWPPKNRQLFSEILSCLNDIPQDAQRGPKVSVILVGRSSDDAWWNERFGGVTGLKRYVLHGLDLSDGMEYARTTLEVSVKSDGPGSHAETEAFENIVGLSCQNPLFLKQVFASEPGKLLADMTRLPGSTSKPSVSAEVEREPLADYAYRLYFNAPTNTLADASTLTGFPCELSSIISGAPPIMAALWGLMSLYWRQGPTQSTLVRTARRLEMGEESTLETQVFSALQVGQDRGYLSVNPNGIIEWIHPLFTTAMRSFCISQTMLSSSQPYNNIFRGIAWVLDSVPNPDSVPSGEVGQIIAMEFIDCIEGKVYQWVKENRLGSLGAEDFEFRLRPMLYNLFLILRICGSPRAEFNVRLWPLQLIMFCAPHLNLELSAAERSMSLSLYQQILERFLEHNGSFAIPAKYQPLIMLIGGSLVSSLHPGPYMPTAKAEKLASQMMGIIAATETRFGPVSGQLPLRMKAVLHMNHARLLLADFDEEGTKRAEQKSFALWQEVFAIEKEKITAGEEGSTQCWVQNRAAAVPELPDIFLALYPYLKCATNILDSMGPDIPIRLTYSPGLRNWRPSQTFMRWLANTQGEVVAGIERSPENIKGLLDLIATDEWEVSLPGAVIANLDPFHVAQTPRRAIRTNLNDVEFEVKLRFLEEAVDIGDWLRAANLYEDLSAGSRAQLKESDEWLYLRNSCRLRGGEENPRPSLVLMTDHVEWHQRRLQLPDLFLSVEVAMNSGNPVRAGELMQKAIEIFEKLGLPEAFTEKARFAFNRFRALTGEDPAQDYTLSQQACSRVMDEYVLRVPGPVVAAGLREKGSRKEDRETAHAGLVGKANELAQYCERWLASFAAVKIPYNFSSTQPRSSKGLMWSIGKVVLDELGVPFDETALPELDKEMKKLAETKNGRRQSLLTSLDALEKDGKFEAAAQALQHGRSLFADDMVMFLVRRGNLECYWWWYSNELILGPELKSDFDQAFMALDALSNAYERGCFVHIEGLASLSLLKVIERSRARVRYVQRGNWDGGLGEVEAVTNLYDQLQNFQFALACEQQRVLKAFYEIQKASNGSSSSLQGSL
ncbi:hypothetical protein LTR22_019254 [Elasticomyces elasticus]|nr:hypothetical protein LTR22_019254 [Elasticomyces elasticus]